MAQIENGDFYPTPEHIHSHIKRSDSEGDPKLNEKIMSMCSYDPIVKAVMEIYQAGEIGYTEAMQQAVISLSESNAQAIKKMQEVRQGEFKTVIMGEFVTDPRLNTLHDLAKEYRRRTNEYDETVCTGPVMQDGLKRPLGGLQQAMVMKNSRAVAEELLSRYPQHGFTRLELNKAVSNVR
jgi:hypothetical protein